MARSCSYIVIPELSVIYSEVNDIADLPKLLVAELKDFFINYNRIEEKEFKISGTIDAKEARKMIKKAIKKGS